MPTKERISGQQCRAARSWCQLESEDLAALVGCERRTISRFENNPDYQLRPATAQAIRDALEARSVKFLFSRKGEPEGIKAADPVKS